MTIRHDEASLRRSASTRFMRATADLERHTKTRDVKGLLAGLLIVLVSIGIVFAAHLLF